MERLKLWLKWPGKFWHRMPSIVRKIIVFAIGVPIIILGIILLPLPGPGWVVIFAGFAVLAIEFETAERVRDWLIGIFKKGAEILKRAWNNMRGKETAELPTEYDATADVELKSEPTTKNTETKH